MLGQPRCADATAVARHARINHGSCCWLQRRYSAAAAAAAALSSQPRLRIDAALLKLVSNTQPARRRKHPWRQPQRRSTTCGRDAAKMRRDKNEANTDVGTVATWSTRLKVCIMGGSKAEREGM